MTILEIIITFISILIIATIVAGLQIKSSEKHYDNLHNNGLYSLEDIRKTIEELYRYTNEISTTHYMALIYILELHKISLQKRLLIEKSTEEKKYIKFQLAEIEKFQNQLHKSVTLIKVDAKNEN